jgi:Ran GTPase-activating protein (RanGAP) involved in mRNA processing and transport
MNTVGGVDAQCVCPNRRGDLDDAAAETVAASISVVSGLRLLRVAHNRLTHLGVSKLLAKLDTSSLIVLDLGDNNLGDRGAFIVAKCLEVSPALGALWVWVYVP